MEHEKETYSDTIENQRQVMEEALRRAHARNVNDMNVYSAAERAPAGPSPAAQLNWAGGSPMMSPSSVPQEELLGSHSAPISDAGACGVDAICRLTDGGSR